MKRLAAAALGAAVGVRVEAALMARERGRPDPAAHDAFGPGTGETSRLIDMDDGGVLHVVERGPVDAPPIVLLHGVTLSTLTWRYQLDDLADRFRVIAVDHRGHGRSRAGSGGHTLPGMAADIAHLLERDDLRGALVVGHSMGGIVAMQLAAGHPDLLGTRVGGLALVATTAAPGARVPGWSRVVEWAAPGTERALRMADRRRFVSLPPNDLSYLIARLGLGARPSPTHVELTRLMHAALPPAVIADLWRELADVDLRSTLPRISVPTTVMVGSRDLVTPPHHSREIHRLVPGAELVSWPGAGHMLMLERRAAFAEAVARAAVTLAS
ncbi:MAG TPA: alpha/beta fold hydrolase [Acidimicrobiales bacterium]|nr:alpha/beta fold hydrolase [Acidimicrobiales bacterium]